MAMAMASSGLAYPERFYAAASYAGFDGSSPHSSSSNFSNDVALLLYALYHQATVGPCNIPKPRGWSPVEQSKWTRLDHQDFRVNYSRFFLSNIPEDLAQISDETKETLSPNPNLQRSASLPIIFQRSRLPVQNAQESFAQRCFTFIDEYAPGFNSSIIGYDMLTPPDLEREIGLTG